ncbi:MAG: sodium:solute symporter family protein [Rhizobacter sp.]|nr:sodium:solute symporter family protein [Chlorobiales bacterium]
MPEKFIAHFTIADFIVIGAYFVAVFVFGFYRKHRTAAEQSQGFLIAGRRLTLPLFVATLVATWYGGILGVGEFSYTQGLASWLALGVFYYVFAALYALFIAGKIRDAGLAGQHLTIPDRLQSRYGRGVAALASVFIFTMITPAPYLLITAILLSMITGFSLEICLLLAALLSVVYIFSGGLESVVLADIVQFALMFIGFTVVIPFAVNTFGGFEFLKASLPASHLRPTGNLSWQQILAWSFVALWTFVDPNFFQRCLAAESSRTAKQGIFVSIGFWVLFDAMTCTAGLYARAALPNINPVMSYPALAEAVLPSFWKGLFYTGMLATVMSTVSGYTFLSAMTIGRDFIHRAVSGDARDEHALKRYVMFGLVMTIAVSLIVAYTMQSIISIWYTLGTIGVPALLLPMLSTFTEKIKFQKGWIAASIVLAPAASIAYLVIGYLNFSGGAPQYPLGIEPMHVGLLVSVAVFACAAAAQKFFPPAESQPVQSPITTASNDSK